MQKYQSIRQSQTQASQAKQTPPAIRPTEGNCIDCSYQTVGDFLNYLHLEQYFDTFLEEGFDSINSLLEITEEDMIFMNVKRGHRRLLQREIATIKGLSRDQPLITNMMGPKYPTEFSNSSAPKMEDIAKRQNLLSNAGFVNSDMLAMMPNYDNIATGLTSPRSMNSGIGSSSIDGCIGNSSSSTLRSRIPHQQASQQVPVHQHQSIQQPQFGYPPYIQHTQLPAPHCQYADSGIGSNSNSSFMVDHNNSELSNKPIINNGNSKSSNNNNDNDMSINSVDQENRSATSPILVTTRNNSTSSNDDNDSTDTNDSIPTKRKYRRHAKPDRYAPVKPPSAYIMFSNDARAQLKDKNLSFAELAKIVGEQWKNLSHGERQNYERMAMRAKDEYLAALEQYRQTPQYERYQEYLSDFKAKQEAANRLIGRVRKRAKHPSPGSGSIADTSSNGASNGNGSSGSGSGGDIFEDKEIRHQGRSSDEEIIVGQSQQAPEYNSGSSSSSGNNNSNTELLQLSHYRHNHGNNTGRGSGSGSGNNSNNSNNSNQFRSSDSGYQSQPFTDTANNQQTNDFRSSQIMRGMLPVDFFHSTLSKPPSAHSYSSSSSARPQISTIPRNSSNATTQQSLSSIDTLDGSIPTYDGQQQQQINQQHHSNKSQSEAVEMYEVDAVDDEVNEDTSPVDSRVLSHPDNENNSNSSKNGTDIQHRNNNGNYSHFGGSSSTSNNNTGRKLTRRSPRIAKTKKVTHDDTTTSNNPNNNNRRNN
ncbi:hypothetical protein BDF20DRAFT_832403 [Mycotypha africana]|uniref:uncharacterized protein n=1 Tax=Mycotypha africana TaxID=64632 RepID=UPI002300ECDB|nr:uncharacterized protein BDF20DRAFT_832403 [Mycotypha africana]KAI8987472.1 hypothetical protein BDF20DRAFT_832403 [Mycotypha africana]